MNVKDLASMSKEHCVGNFQASLVSFDITGTPVGSRQRPSGEDVGGTVSVE